MTRSRKGPGGGAKIIFFFFYKIAFFRRKKNELTDIIVNNPPPEKILDPRLNIYITLYSIQLFSHSGFNINTMYKTYTKRE